MSCAASLPSTPGSTGSASTRAPTTGPFPHADHPGTPMLHEGRFRNGRGIFKVINYRDPAETINSDYPVWLTTGRRLQSYHTRTQTGRAQGIDYFLSEESLEVHPGDVEAWGLQNQGWCRLSSRRGSVQIKVRATRRSPRGNGIHEFQFQRRAHQHPDRLWVRPHHLHRRVQGLPGAHRGAGDGGGAGGR